MSSWQYVESKDIWGLRRVRELHSGKMRPFLYIISVAPSFGPLISMKSPFFNFRSAKLPSLTYMHFDKNSSGEYRVLLLRFVALFPKVMFVTPSGQYLIERIESYATNIRFDKNLSGEYRVSLMLTQNTERR